jgi:hypothetical protein
MEPDDLLHLQGPATCPYPQPDRSSVVPKDQSGSDASVYDLQHVSVLMVSC